MDRLRREGNPPSGQLASPVPQYKDVTTDEWEYLKGESGSSYVKDRDMLAKLLQVKTLLEGVATETKLEQARALLATISAKDFATETTLAAAKVVLDSISGKDYATQTTLAAVQDTLEALESKIDDLADVLTDGSQKVQQSGDIPQLDITNGLLATISRGQVMPQMTSWQQVQYIVRAGLADKIFKIGDQILAAFDDVPVVWDVIGIDHDTPSDPNYTHSLTIQTHNCLMNAQFSAPQALWYAEGELAAGTHIFTQDGSNIKYSFTTTKPIPEGGQVMLSMNEYVPITATTYEADRATVIESGLAVIEIASGSDTLLDITVRARVRYGSNNYVESAIRQWLNSKDEVFQWQPQTPFDRPSSYSGTGGFLHRLDPELAGVIGHVNKQVARNTVTDGGKQDTFSDKVFLLSRVEVGLGTEGTTTGEAVYDYYNGSGDEGRIKLLSEEARYWWLRSPYTGNAYGVRGVYTSGALSTHVANGSYGAAPACCIV